MFSAKPKFFYSAWSYAYLTLHLTNKTTTLDGLIPRTAGGGTGNLMQYLLLSAGAFRPGWFASPMRRGEKTALPNGSLRHSSAASAAIWYMVFANTLLCCFCLDMVAYATPSLKSSADELILWWRMWLPFCAILYGTGVFSL